MRYNVQLAFKGIFRNRTYDGVYDVHVVLASCISVLQQQDLPLKIDILLLVGETANVMELHPL